MMNPFKAPSLGGSSFAGALAGLQQPVQAQKASQKTQQKLCASVDDWLGARHWDCSELELVCVEKRRETHDVVTLVLQGTQPLLFHFKPGQFVTLGVVAKGEQVWRSYTISSSPSRPYSLEVTVKKVSGGLVSGYLVDEFAIGDSLKALPPAGEFNLAQSNTDKYLLLSAGSGITPMMSMTAFIADTRLTRDIAFVHSARSNSDIIFERRLRKLATHKAGFKLAFVLENMTEPEPVTSSVAVTSGRLDWPMLVALVPDLMQREVFVCGPAPYMQSVRVMLEAAGFDMSRYHQESFMPVATSAVPLDGKQAESSDSGRSLAVTWGQNQTQVEAGSSVLEAAEELELPIITACRAGVCGACKCKVVKGDVRSSSQVSLTDEEVKSGVVLACASTLHSDAELALV